MHNQGTARSAATTLRYYRSTDAKISGSDTEVGTDAVRALSASRTSDESIRLTAPSSAGTYHYGACVDSVSGEVNAEPLGVSADIVDDAGRPVATGEVGELVLREANIGMTRGVWRDPDRYLDTYWNQYDGRLWRQGDWARRDEDGQWFVEGRSDDTLKIAGKRTGPAEIEGLALATGALSEAAAVGVPDPVTGQALLLAMVPSVGVEPGTALECTTADAVGAGLGRPFRPKRQLFVSDLPKTRNTKILRRVVKAVVKSSSGSRGRAEHRPGPARPGGRSLTSDRLPGA